MLVYLSIITAFSAEVQLFDSNREPVKDYYQKIMNLKFGDLISFSNGVTFHYFGLLNPNDGNQSFVIDIGENRVLRIPRITPETSNQNVYVAYDAPGGTYRYDVEEFSTNYKDPRYRLFAYERGWENFQSWGIPTVNLNSAKSYLPEYIVQEKLNVIFSLVEYIQHLDNPGQINSILNEKIKFLRTHQPDFKSSADINFQTVEKEFFNFCKKTAPLKFATDLHAENIVYTEDRGWLVLDFGSATQRAVFLSDQNLISSSILNLFGAIDYKISNKKLEKFISRIDKTILNQRKDIKLQRRKCRFLWL